MSDDKDNSSVDVEALVAENARLQEEKASILAKANELLSETKAAKEAARIRADETKAAQEASKGSSNIKQLLESSEKERQILAKRFSELESKVSSEKTKNVSMKLAAELADGANAELLSEFVSKRIKYVDGDIKVLNSNGGLTMSSLDDLKREFETSDKFKSLIRGSKASGGNSGGDGGSAPSANVKPRAEFDSMNPAQQMEFIKKGGSFKD